MTDANYTNVAGRHIRNDVVVVLQYEFQSTINYQKNKNDITVAMTFEEYVGLWSLHRLRTIQTKIDEGVSALRRYLTNEAYRPVCGWKTKEDFVKGGTMHVGNARIISAETSKRMFQFSHGDKHSDESKRKISQSKSGVRQTEQHRAAMSASLKGKPKAKWTPERVAARKALLAKKKAESLEAQKGA